jgi:hypothetical protein
MVADAADDADGADGVCDRRMHSDDPASGAAFTTEGYLDAQGPQERLRARALWAITYHSPVAATASAGPQKIGGGPVEPDAALV